MTGMRPRGKRLMLNILLGQMVIGAIALLLSWTWSGVEAAQAATFGAGTAIVPGLYFALRVFATPPGTPPQRMLAKLYAGEVGKLVLTAVLFYGAVKWYPTQLLPVILTYVACLSVNWVAMLKMN